MAKTSLGDKTVPQKGGKPFSNQPKRNLIQKPEAHSATQDSLCSPAWKRQQEELEIQSCSFTPFKEPVIDVIDPKPRLEQCETNCVGQYPKGRTDESMNDEELESKVLVILDDWRKQSSNISLSN